jgi:hypothetical protein
LVLEPSRQRRQDRGRDHSVLERREEGSDRAHRRFSDRVVVGWDIAVLDDGPIFIEGNGNPDLDILQRFMRMGLREHRFARLLAYHLGQRSIAA